MIKMKKKQLEKLQTIKREVESLLDEMKDANDKRRAEALTGVWKTLMEITPEHTNTVTTEK